MECFRCKKSDVQLEIWTRKKAPRTKLACQGCIKILSYSRRFYNKTRETRIAQTIKNHRIDKWQNALVANAKYRAKLKGMDFDLDSQFVLGLFKSQNQQCYWTGIVMSPSMIGRDPARPSLERLDTNGGYTKSNCVLACQFVNIGRGEADIGVFKNFLENNGLSKFKRTE